MTPSDHPTWGAPAPPIELPSPPAAYPPILLFGFNKEEYATLPAKGEDGNAIVAQGNELARVKRVVAEGAEGMVAEGEHLL